jgi:hypothetical protein
MKGDTNEKQVTQAWLELLKSGCKLETETGQSLRVIYPGKTSDAPGSDFQDAVVDINKHIFKGNIEIHVNSSGWRSHQHHLNPAYNNVVLHVALRHDRTGDILLENGDAVPAVILGKYFRNENVKPAPGIVRCYGAGISNPDRLLEILNTAGAARFYEKARELQIQFQHQEAAQILYTGIMTALGYAKNKEPFGDLAGRVPLAALATSVNENITGAQARLIGTAGLLPSQRPECEYSPVENYAYVEQLEKAWANINQTEVMDFRYWQPFRVRPSNSPLRRMAGMCLLLLRYQQKGLLSGLRDLVADTLVENGGHVLEKGLMVRDEGYWGSRFDFGKGYTGLSPWLIGEPRAGDIVINVLLPFVYALGRQDGDGERPEKALDLFRHYPAGESNTVIRHMQAQFGLKSQSVNSAQRQQGLLHLYKKWCTQGRCGECKVVKRKIPKIKCQITNNI